jgi:hypothetical protein
MISGAAIVGVLMVVAGMAFFAFGLAEGKTWDWRPYAALVMMAIGLALTVYFGVVG